MLNYIPAPVSEVKKYGVIVLFIVFSGLGVPYGCFWFLVDLLRLFFSIRIKKSHF